jgi:hypothetical protein
MLKLGVMSIVFSLGACATTRYGFSDAAATQPPPATRGYVQVSAAQPSEPVAWGYANVPAAQPPASTLWGFAEVPGPAVKPSREPVATQR